MTSLDLQNAIGDTLLQVVLQQQAQRKRLQEDAKDKASSLPKAA